MIEIKNITSLEDYQLRELEEGRLFINKYDSDCLMYDYELKAYWEILFFDIMQELAKKKGFAIMQSSKENLFEYIKKEYYNIIKEYKLKIDLRDYVELNDYISLKEWEQKTGNFLIKVKGSFFLVTIE